MQRQPRRAREAPRHPRPPPGRYRRRRLNAVECLRSDAAHARTACASPAVERLDEELWRGDHRSNVAPGRRCKTNSSPCSSTTSNDSPASPSIAISIRLSGSLLNFISRLYECTPPSCARKLVSMDGSSDGGSRPKMWAVVTVPPRRTPSKSPRPPSARSATGLRLLRRQTLRRGPAQAGSRSRPVAPPWGNRPPTRTSRASHSTYASPQPCRSAGP